MAVMAVFEMGLATTRTAPTCIARLWSGWKPQRIVSAADAAGMPVTLVSAANKTTAAVNLRARIDQPETHQHRMSPREPTMGAQRLAIN